MAEHVVVEQLATRASNKNGAKGNTVRNIFPKDGTRHIMFNQYIIEPEGNTPMHSHAQEHVHYVLAGSGILVEDAATYSVAQGSATYIRGGVPHYFANNGTENLVLLAVRGPEVLNDSSKGE